MYLLAASQVSMGTGEIIAWFTIGGFICGFIIWAGRITVAATKFIVVIDARHDDYIKTIGELRGNSENLEKQRYIDGRRLSDIERYLEKVNPNPNSGIPLFIPKDYEGNSGELPNSSGMRR